MKKILTWMFVGLLFSATLASHASNGEQAAPTPLVQPKFVSGTAPTYPAEAYATGKSGRVVIEALIDEKGRIFASEVVASADDTLDAAALQAVADWVFEPAKRDGKPTMVVVRIPVDFVLSAPGHDRQLAVR